jgi:phage terminase large subunit GpA-like protein
MINKPDIFAFLKSIGTEVLPHEVEPYSVFNGERSRIGVVIVKSRQVRGTEFCKNVALYHLAGKGNKHENTLHVFPRQEMASRYAKYRVMTSIDEPYTYLNEQLSEDERSTISGIPFKHDCRYYIFSASGQADALRGLSADMLIRDEVDQFLSSAIRNLDACTSACEFPIILDIGTPAGNKILKSMWEQSDKREYFYCCDVCHDYFKPTIDLLCGIADIKCPNCQTEQSKMSAALDGKWIQMRNPKFATQIGFHFTQLINPLIETIQILRWKEEFSSEKFKAEVLGEF